MGRLHRDHDQARNVIKVARIAGKQLEALAGPPDWQVRASELVSRYGVWHFLLYRFS